ncbi:LacI family DNA-binding transcriptional regulator [Kordiimonas sp.]|uniref:LacI family DNA-binding transcriptional regulator n=1 Tax=Kordiimonas sp. TaxID=1970157 RepID=UPI003B5220D4
MDESEKKNLRRLEDLALLANVSISTVSRALNDSPLVSDRTKKRIMSLAHNNNYSGRLKDKVYADEADKTISIIIPPPQGRDTRLSDPFTLDLIGGIGDALKERNCDMLISHLTMTDYQSAANLVASGRCDGLVVIGQSTLHAQLNQLAQKKVPFVAWGAQLPEQQYCSVGSDNQQGGRRATNHLIRMGCKRIVFVGDAEGPEVQLRLAGYREALELNGIAYQEELVRPAHFYPESGMEAIDVLIEQGIKFDGVVAASDMIAIGAMRGIARAGLRIPQDVSVIGYDDVLVAAYSSPALSTIRQDVTKAGRLLVSKLLRMLEGQTVQSSNLPTDLIIRESCGS